MLRDRKRLKGEKDQLLDGINCNNLIGFTFEIFFKNKYNTGIGSPFHQIAATVIFCRQSPSLTTCIYSLAKAPQAFI
jgi:hypothetical protein